jgi:cytoskeleton protein RodZ
MTEVEINKSKVAAVSSPQAMAPLAAAPGAGGAEAESFGRALAQARQARGLSQGDVAAQLRLQLRQVRAIEAEDLAALPESAFVRGFVRNYAKLVELPAEPLLKLLNARLQPASPLRGDRAGNAASPVQLASRERTSRLAVIGGAMALLLVFALLGWWTMRPSQPSVEPTVQQAITPPKAAPAEAVQPAAAPAQAVQPAAAPAEATQQSATPSATPPPAGASQAVPVPATAPPPALHFNFRGRSWVEVRQADGTVLMSRSNNAGAQAKVEGTPPYALVIGNASKVDLEFRGKTIDLREFAGRGDIARLRLE